MTKLLLFKFKSSLLITIVLLQFILPQTVSAQTCAEVGGHCTPLNCAHGEAPGTCTIPLVERCCNNDPTPPPNGGGATQGELLCNGGINTAIGCIPVESPQQFTAFLLRWAIGIGGGVAMLFIIYAGFLIMTSSGNPKQVSAGRELLTAAVSGLAFLIMSAFLLNFIGVEVLNLPNF